MVGVIQLHIKLRIGLSGGRSSHDQVSFKRSTISKTRADPCQKEAKLEQQNDWSFVKHTNAAQLGNKTSYESYSNANSVVCRKKTYKSRQWNMHAKGMKRITWVTRAINNWTLFDYWPRLNLECLDPGQTQPRLYEATWLECIEVQGGSGRWVGSA